MRPLRVAGVAAGSPVPEAAFPPIPAVSAAPSAPGPSWAGNVPVSPPSPSGRRSPRRRTGPRWPPSPCSVRPPSCRSAAAGARSCCPIRHGHRSRDAAGPPAGSGRPPGDGNGTSTRTVRPGRIRRHRRRPGPGWRGCAPRARRLPGGPGTAAGTAGCGGVDTCTTGEPCGGPSRVRCATGRGGLPAHV